MRVAALKDLREHPQPQFLPLGEVPQGHFLLEVAAGLLQTRGECRLLPTAEVEVTQPQDAVEALVEV
jgi:hypothetical protein